MPQALWGQTIRKPVIAGSFYPDNPEKLRAMISEFSTRADLAGKTIPGDWELKALVMPHAGFVFSGPTAAHVASYLQPTTVSKVIVMGPDHRVGFSGCAVSDAEFWETPLGKIPVHAHAHALSKASPAFRPIPESDRLEHSIEAVLPFLQTYLENFSLIPVVTGSCHIRDTARVLSNVMDGNTLLVVSSDLSHYLDQKTARKKDKQTIEMILNLDRTGLEKSTNAACGKAPLLVLMELARTGHWKPVLLNYSTSGDRKGPKNRVVGYAAMAFFQTSQDGSRPEKALSTAAPKNQSLSPDQGRLLVKLARTTIARKLEKPVAHQDDEDLEQGLGHPVFTQPRATFVTLYLGGRLRGCMGSLEPKESLWDSIRSNALNAALRDPRFPKLTPGELSQVLIEVSILTRPEKLEFSGPKDLLSQIDPGIDGVILKKGWARATYLPQVWDQIPDKRSFLSHLCQKAGLSPREWETGQVEVFTYQVQHFEESRPLN